MTKFSARLEAAHCVRTGGERKTHKKITITSTLQKKCFKECFRVRSKEKKMQKE
jgi:hypothetical protein